MRQIYTLAFYFLVPFVLLRLWWRGRQQYAYRKRISERFGKPNFPALSQSLWIHAVSYGEAIAAESLIRALQQEYPNINIVVTTMTITGSQRIQQSFPQIYHCYVPYDIPFGLQRFYRHTNPKLIIIMETELWPNMLYYAQKNNIPVILANARLSLRSLRGYKRLPQSLKKILLSITNIAAQTKADAQRFVELGFPDERVLTTGNLKFDIQIPHDMVAQGKKIRSEWQRYKHVWIAASTHDGEEEQILQVFAELLQQFPSLLLILVPRHPERFEAMTKLCRTKGFQTANRSQGFQLAADTQIFIGDSMGEMYLFYAMADVAFVGGSFAKAGGHNLLEPAAVQIPIFSGPHLHNFVEISQLLVKAKVLSVVNDKEELKTQLQQFLTTKEAGGKSHLLDNYMIFNEHQALKKHLQIIRNTLVFCSHRLG